MLILKTFQQDIIDSAVNFFSEYDEQLIKIRDSRNRKKFISENGCILIEAPTGAGKTLVAGHIANQMTQVSKVAWLWFAPFTGLVAQAEKTINSEFSNLKIRDIRHDRNFETVNSGDIFVTTWASVATKKTESRKIRSSKESTISIDELITLLKLDGYRIGVVVDEAHHGFKENTNALQFYRDILDPDFTILVTATPRDKDIEKFKEAVGFNNVHRLAVSREQSVEAGLVKKGVRAIAYISNSSNKFVDYEKTAYRHGLKMQKTIKSELEANGIDLEPLLLVQVESGTTAANNAKNKLIELGMPAEHIAIHTADEPDPDILALASDENVKVLIFKMSIAMGFDAPRAFTLISMRKSKDPNFGVQVVGRILRVHKKLQGKKLPDILNYGYVFLADYESQTGLTNAAKKINEIKSELISASTNLSIVTVADDDGNVYTIKNGEVSFWLDNETFINKSEKSSPTAVKFNNDALKNSDEITDGNQLRIDLFDEHKKSTTLERNELDSGNSEDNNLDTYLDRPLIDLLEGLFDGVEKTNVLASQDNASEELNKQIIKIPTYQLRQDIRFPHQFKREQIKLGVTDSILNCVVSHINFDSDVITGIFERSAKVTKRDIEIFSQTITDEEDFADISMKEVTALAQQSLFENDYLNGRKLYDALILKLKEEVVSRGWPEETYNDKIEDGLYIILIKHPNLLKSAIRRCLKDYIYTENASLIDNVITSEIDLTTSKLNIYKVFPTGMNRWERKFAQIIDNDTTGTVLWWHRNEPRKPWGVSIAMMDSKHDFWPDFIVGVKDRDTENQILLVETKGAYKTKDSVLKARARHKDYGNVLTLHWKDEADWHTVINDDDGTTNILDQLFRISIMKGY